MESPNLSTSVNSQLGAIFAGCSKPPKVWVMITAYFDESGTHDDAKSTAFAGYFGTNPEWASFSLQWQLCLERHGICGSFHMSEFESRKGQYANQSDDDRFSLIKSLSNIIVKHDIAGVAISLDTTKHRSLTADRKRFGKYADPYYLLMMLVMAECVLSIANTQPNEKILFIFDRRAGCVELAESVFDSMLKAHPWVKGVVSDQIVFASTDSQVPLQAADILAYETYKRSLDPDRAERKLFSALKPTFERIKMLSDTELSMYNLEATLKEIMNKKTQP